MSDSAVPDTYGDVTGEYLELRNGAGLVAGAHEVVWVEGPDAVSFLDGLLSQDVTGLAVHEAARSLLLEPRGRITELLWVLRGEDRVGLVCDPGRAGPTIAALTSFLFRVDTELHAGREPAVEVWGPGAAGVLEAAGLPAPGGWRPAGRGLVASLPLGGLDRYLVVGAHGLEEAGARPAGSIAATAVRLEAGEPLTGVDVGEDTIPHETGLVPFAVSFTKGCYLGQELVARIDSRGHVNRHLRGVVVGENVLPPVGAVLLSADDGGAGETEVGRLSSVAESLAVGAPIGIGFVRREVEPGTPVRVSWQGGEAAGEVRALPLDDFS
jgi:folate-binding protein YgfZ